MSKYKYVSLGENVEEMFIGPFGSCLKNECFVNEDEAYCMVYEQKHAIQKTMDVETRYVNEQKYNELKRFNIHGGDIIVSCRGTIGETFIVPADAPLGIMHPSIMKIRLKDGVYDKYYFNLLLMSRLKKHEAEANGSGIKMVISATELGKELFPVPTMEEQKEITDIISKISYVIEKRKQELSDLDELIKSRFVEMFGNPIINTKGWPKKRFDEICENLDSRRKPITASEREAGRYPYYGASGVVDYVANYIFDEDLLLVSEDGANLLMRSTPIAFSVSGKVWVNNHAHVVRFKEMSMQKYIEIYFSMIDISDQITGSAQPKLNQAKLNAIRFAIPNEALLDEYYDFIKKVDKSKVIVQKSLDETQLLFDSLMQKYFG